jgi:hypothetical protein
MKAELRYESSDGGGEALPGKEKTAAKGDTLTTVFQLIVISNQFPLHPLTLRLIGGQLINIYC